MNIALMQTQDRLVKTHARLRERLRQEDDAQVRRALLNELTEIMARVQMVGAVLFAEQSAQLDAKAAAVKIATTKVNKAIRDMQSMRDLLDAISGFLALVDEAIDLAKLAML